MAIADASARLLLIDEDAPELWQLAQPLAREGYSVTICIDSSEAARIIASDSFDCTLVSLAMTRSNGLALVRQLLERHPGALVMGMAPAGSPLLRAESPPTGLAQLLVKPVSDQALREALQQAARDSARQSRLPVSELFDYLQFALMTRQQKLLQVELEGNSCAGKIYLKEGDLLHVVWGELEGVEALSCCLTAAGGTFSVASWSDPPRRSLTGRGETILLNAFRLAKHGAVSSSAADPSAGRRG